MSYYFLVKTNETRYSETFFMEVGFKRTYHDWLITSTCTINQKRILK